MATEKVLYLPANGPYDLFYRKNAPEYPVGAHTHNAAELYLTLTDLPDMLLNDAVRSVRRGTLIIIPPFCVHQLFHRKGEVYERYVLSLEPSWLSAIPGDDGAFAEHLRRADQPEVLLVEENALGELTKVMDRCLNDREENAFARMARLYEVLSVMDRVIRTAGTGTEPRGEETEAQKTVNAIIAYINAHLEEGITVPEIAARFYLNKDYLSRLFARYTHTTLGHFIAIQRITRAQELLRSGMTVNEVQERMGYSGYANFFKAFKTMIGISPSVYRAGFMRGKENESAQ